jgi:hypothetical protein
MENLQNSHFVVVSAVLAFENSNEYCGDKYFHLALQMLLKVLQQRNEDLQGQTSDLSNLRSAVGKQRMA